MISATKDLTSLAGNDLGHAVGDIVDDDVVDDEARQFSMEEETEESVDKDEDDDDETGGVDDDVNGGGGGGGEDDEATGSNKVGEVEDESSFEPSKDEEGKPIRVTAGRA